MIEDKSIMKYDTVLPANFDGVFRFSNPTDEDFVGVWNSKEYLFPAKTMTPISIPEHSPLEIQHIRKKFAKDLAEREYYKSKGYKVFQDQEGKPGNKAFSSIHQAPAYTIKDLTPFIQSCLEPLPEGTLTARVVEREPLENKIHRTDDGKLTTEAIDSKASLRDRALHS